MTVVDICVIVIAILCFMLPGDKKKRKKNDLGKAIDDSLFSNLDRKEDNK